jgi:hypothetical protein
MTSVGPEGSGGLGPAAAGGQASPAAAGGQASGGVPPGASDPIAVPEQN